MADSRRVLERRDVDVDLDRVVREDVLELLAVLVGGDRLVLVGEEDVAVAAEEVLQRLTAGLVLDLHVLGDELVEVVEARLGVLPAVGRVAVAGEQVPLRRARGERVRREDLDARLEQVVPGLDVLRVALADDERDDRGRDQALVVAVLPRRVDQAGVDEPGHVGLGGERDDVGLLAGLDGARLVAGGAERRLELDPLALRRLAEGGDDLVVDDLRRGVRDERQRALRAVAAGRGSAVPSVRLIRGAAAAHDHRGRKCEQQRHGELPHQILQS